MAFFLSSKEIWRNKGRFLLFSLVITLITTLVLFVAALAEGLAQANRQYLEKLDAELLVFQENSDLSPITSRLDRFTLNDIKRVEGVQAAGPIGFASAAITFPDGREDVKVSIIGVEPGTPGIPPVLTGNSFTNNRGSDIIIDSNTAEAANLRVGDTFWLKTIQGNEEEFSDLRVVGLTDGREYQYAPSIFLPYQTWDQVRPQGDVPAGLVEVTSNVIAVKLTDPQQQAAITERIQAEVNDVEVVDVQTAIKALPGYSAQQSTLQTQQVFVLLIGILVIGGFFQIQMLQKIPQIGVLKAIGVTNRSVAWAVVWQIILVTTFGVFLGGMVTMGLAAGIPNIVPVEFSGTSVAVAVIALLAIGPIGGLVSVRLAVRVEPLIALGLSQ